MNGEELRFLVYLAQVFTQILPYLKMLEMFIHSTVMQEILLCEVVLKNLFRLVMLEIPALRMMPKISLHLLKTSPYLRTTEDSPNLVTFKISISKTMLKTLARLILIPKKWPCLNLTGNSANLVIFKISAMMLRISPHLTVVLEVSPYLIVLEEVSPHQSMFLISTLPMMIRISPHLTVVLEV